ncbi:MAG TPA: hypothetical protein ENL03_00335 [Phycisphaerae bacterium]|nr:hypothetical protein [Phycisphaerae bacterium]
MKLLLKIVVVLLVLLVITGTVAWIWIDSIAKTAVVEGTKYAFNVDASLDDMSVSLLGGTIEMEEYTLGIPEGFDEAEYSMLMGNLKLGVDTGTLTDDLIVVNEFIIDGIELHFVKKDGKNNFSVMFDHAAEKLGSDDDKEKPKGEGKKIKVGKIEIRNVVAHFHVQPLPGMAAVSILPVKIDELILEDVSSEEGVPVAQLATRILPAILAGVVNSGAGIPSDVLGSLDSTVKGFSKSMGGNVEKLIKQSEAFLGDALKKPKEIIDEVLKKNPLDLIPGIGGDKDKDKDE